MISNKRYDNSDYIFVYKYFQAKRAKSDFVLKVKFLRFFLGRRNTSNHRLPMFCAYT